jgi:hypothetical protein
VKVVSVIPSKGRPDGLSSRTLSWLCMSKHDWFVFVEPQEYEEYLRVVPRDQLVKIDDSDRGLGYVKNFIQNWLKDKDYDLVFKLDDDIITWHDRGSRKSPERCAQAFDKAIADAAAAFTKYPDVAAVSYPYRNELYELQKWAALNARLQTAYLVRKDYFVGHKNVSTFEDFYNYIYIRSKNKLILRYGLLGISTDVGRTAGGLQSPSFSRRQMAEAEVPILRELYPALEFKPVTGKAWHIEPVLKGPFFGVKKL